MYSETKIVETYLHMYIVHQYTSILYDQLMNKVGGCAFPYRHRNNQDFHVRVSESPSCLLFERCSTSVFLKRSPSMHINTLFLTWIFQQNFFFRFYFQKYLNNHLVTLTARSSVSPSLIFRSWQVFQITLYRHRTRINKFLLVKQHWRIHARKTIG